MRKISQFISWAFNPLIMPIYALDILFHTTTFAKRSIDIKDNLFTMNDRMKLVFILLFLCLLFLAPLGSLLIMKKNKHIESIELNKRSERPWPIMVTGFYALILFLILFRQVNTIYFSFIFHAIAALGVISSAVAYLLTKLFKISLHALSAGLLAGVVMYAYLHFYIPNLFVLIAVIILGGIIMSARYYLQKHNFAQLLSGYVTGLTLAILVLTISGILL